MCEVSLLRKQFCTQHSLHRPFVKIPLIIKNHIVLPQNLCAVHNVYTYIIYVHMYKQSSRLHSAYSARLWQEVFKTALLSPRHVCFPLAFRTCGIKYFVYPAAFSISPRFSPARLVPGLARPARTDAVVSYLRAPPPLKARSFVLSVSFLHTYMFTRSNKFTYSRVRIR